MLVDNKFLFLKIPRTATVAFERSCFLAGFSIKYPTNNVLAQRQADRGLEPRRHAHERISKLREHFGYDYPVIAINRDPLDRFLSAWKYVIKFIAEYNVTAAQILTSTTTLDFINAWENEIGFSSNLQDIEKCSNFFKRLIPTGLPYSKNTYMIFSSVMTAPSRWHENDESILYFNLKENSKIEKYVKEITGKPFDFIITNHTKNIECNLTIDGSLEDFYFNFIEPPYKKSSTLI